MQGLAIIRALAVSLALLIHAVLPAAAQAPAKTYTIELEAEKDYFAPGTVSVIAVSRSAGQVPAGEFDVTIRRRRDISVPADTSELLFRAAKNITARLKLSAPGGTIIVRPLSSAGSVSGIAWMLGRRGGIAVEKLAVEFAGR
jgi:hypothetical protein